MNAWILRGIHAWDRLRFAFFRRRFGDRLAASGDVSPNLRFSALRVEPGGLVEVGAGYAAERRRGNHLWVQSGGVLSLGPRVWLRTECGPNYLTVAEKARLELGARC